MTHPLKDYIVATADTVAGFARRVGTSRQTISRIIAGLQSPKPDLARRIAEATGGAVPLEAFFGPRVEDLAGRRSADDALDVDLLAIILRFVLRTVADPSAPPPADETIDVAAEAVASTHAALARVTTRRGPDRLAQALRPVLEEIQKECPELLLSLERLDEAAASAGALYFQAMPLVHRQ
ncbi:MAG: helix-turn-helix transcriptional regulator [Parvularculaceae bacterium]